MEQLWINDTWMLYTDKFGNFSGAIWITISWTCQGISMHAIPCIIIYLDEFPYTLPLEATVQLIR